MCTQTKGLFVNYVLDSCTKASTITMSCKGQETRLDIKQYLVKAKRQASTYKTRSCKAQETAEDGRGCACLSADPGPGSTFGGDSIGRLSGVGALLDCVPRVCGGGGGCAGGDVPLEAVPALSWCGEVSLGGIQSSPSRKEGVLLGCPGGGRYPSGVNRSSS